MTSDQTPHEILLDRGWLVAVHNHYHLEKKRHSFWLFTHPDGVWIKGEGLNDEDALNELPALAYEKLKEHREARAALAQIEAVKKAIGKETK